MRRRPRLAAPLLVLAALAGCTPPPASVPEVAVAPLRPARNAPERAVQLLGKLPGDVTAILGQPVLRHPESGGEVWLYAHANGCSLDIMMFPAGPAAKVAHATTRSPVTLGEKDCLRAIADASP
ncbi:MAG: hypothetical protein NT133_13765 [Alphaproteobacteria bacterium]|nr:hypothetical protein [Alphaproteobacteria bacterium]